MLLGDKVLFALGLSRPQNITEVSLNRNSPTTDELFIFLYAPRVRSEYRYQREAIPHTNTGGS